MENGNSDNNSQKQPNPNAAAWQTLENQSNRDKKLIISSGFESGSRGKFVMGPDGKAISKEDYDAAMEAKEREDYDMKKLHDRLEEMGKNPNRLDNFEGETNTNKNGKTRTFSEWDVYPIMKGEKPKDFGERAKHRHQMESEFGNMVATDENGMRTEEYLSTKQGQSELETEKDFDALTARVDKAVAEGKMTREAANEYLNRRLELATQDIDSFRQSFNEHQKENNPDEATPEQVSSDSQPPALVEQDSDNKDKEQADEGHEAEKDRQEMMEKSKDATEKIIARAKEVSKAVAGENGIKHLKNAEAIMEKLKELENGEKKAERAQEIKDLERQIEEAKKELKRREESLAESYAKNRRLFVGGKNRKEYMDNKQKYGESLTKYLQLEAELKEYEGAQKIREQIRTSCDKLMQDITDEKISPEDAGKALSDKWMELSKKLQTDVSTQFVEQFIKENKDLENKTIDRIDNGSLYRKAVSKIIDNKVLKVALGAAGVAALGATGFGLATGAVAATLSYTTGGILAGAGRGALSGMLMSRQSSKNSAVRGFVNEDEIKQKLESIDAVKNDQDVKNVTDWLMGQYDAANKADRSSNRKRTLIASTIGAVMGGVMSGVQINKVTTEHKSYDKVIGHEPTEQHAALVNEVDHAKGTGTQQLFRELNGDGDSYFSSGAHEMMQDVLSKYEMTPDVYAGKLADWPETARIAYTEVADEWAKHGLVDAIKTGGGPIYDTYSYTVNNIIADDLRNFFTQAGTAATAGALGGTISRIRNRIRNPRPVPNVTPAAEPTSPFEQTPSQVSANQPDQASVNQSTQQSAQPNQAPAQQPTQQPNQAPTAQPDQAPSQTGDVAPDDDYIRATIDRFKDIPGVGEEGIKYLTSTDEQLSANDINGMNYWSEEINSDVLRSILDYLRANADKPQGKALREYLEGEVGNQTNNQPGAQPNDQPGTQPNDQPSFGVGGRQFYNPDTGTTEPLNTDRSFGYE